MGGVRQQFSTEPEVRLAQASVRLFRELGPPLFEQVGYLFLATTESGVAEQRARADVQRSLGVRVEDVDPGIVRGLHTDDVLGAVVCRGRDRGSRGRDPRARAARRGARGGGPRAHGRPRARERRPRRRLRRPVARGRGPRGVEVRSGRSSVSSPTWGRSQGSPSDLPMTVEETGFHFRRVGADRLGSR